MNKPENAKRIDEGRFSIEELTSDEHKDRAYAICANCISYKKDNEIKDNFNVAHDKTEASS